MRKLNREQEIIECACGCGETLEKFDFQWRSRKFITGHNAKVSPPRPRVNFKQMCACGCGEETNYGKEYVYGHYARVHNPMDSEEAKEKHLAAMNTPERKAMLSMIRMGKVNSPETRAKLSLALAGRDTPWMKGEKNVMNDPIIKERCRLRIIESRTPEVAAKTKATMIERYGADNYSQTDAFKNLIRLENHPNWKGGITGEREAHYSRAVWKEISKAIWKRDEGTCQRCHIHQAEKETAFNIHHIVGFETVELRDDPDNLVLLCRECHSFVHSKKNSGEYRVAIQT